MYLISVMSQCYYIIIDQGISAPGHGKDVVDGINDVYKRYIYQFISTVQLYGSTRIDSNIQMHTGSQKDYVSLAKKFQHYLKKSTAKMMFDHGKNKK